MTLTDLWYRNFRVCYHCCKARQKKAVQGLSMTSDHYKTACKILEDRYGRTERIIFTHIQKILSITIPSECL